MRNLHILLINGTFLGPPPDPMTRTHTYTHLHIYKPSHLSRSRISLTLFQRDIFKSVDKWTEFAPLNANEPEPNANEFYREVPFIPKKLRVFSVSDKKWTISKWDFPAFVPLPGKNERDVPFRRRLWAEMFPAPLKNKRYLAEIFPLFSGPLKSR